MNTSDMHPFIHPLSAAAVDPARSEKRLGNLQSHREEILEVCVGHLGKGGMCLPLSARLCR